LLTWWAVAMALLAMLGCTTPYLGELLGCWRIILAWPWFAFFGCRSGWLGTSLEAMQKGSLSTAFQSCEDQAWAMRQIAHIKACIIQTMHTFDWWCTCSIFIGLHAHLGLVSIYLVMGSAHRTQENHIGWTYLCNNDFSDTVDFCSWVRLLSACLWARVSTSCHAPQPCD